MFEVQCAVCNDSHAICWCWLIQCMLSGQKSAIYQEHFMFPSVDMLYGDATLLFQQDFAKTEPNAFLTMILLCLISQPICLTWTSYILYQAFSKGRWETPDPNIQTSSILHRCSTNSKLQRMTSKKKVKKWNSKNNS